MKIGIFDSGIGGLSVLHLAMRKLPDQDFLYYADEQHVPYGCKPRAEVIRYTDEAVEFLRCQGAQTIIIACNTATSAAINFLREKYDFPIIGMEPAVKKAIDVYGEHKVLAVATPITVGGKKMQGLIERVDKHHLVDLVPLPQLVEYAEREEFDSPAVITYLQARLGAYPLAEYTALVLGCTHFNYFKNSFRTVLGPAIHFVDGNEGTINHMMDESGLKERSAAVSPRSVSEAEAIPSRQTGRVRFFFSGREVTGAAQQRRLQSYLARLDEMLEVQ